MGGPPDGRRVVDGGGPLDGEPEAGCPWARTVDGYGEFSKICFNKCLWVQGRTDPHILSTHMTFLGWGLGVAGLRGNLETPAEGGQRIPPLSRQCAAPLTGLAPPRVPTDFVRGIPFRSEPGSFSGPGRPWRSNNDCGSGRGHGGSRAHPLLPAPPVHSWAEQGRSQWGGAEVGGARAGSGPGVAGARLAAQGARWEQWAGVDTPRGASRAGASGGGGALRGGAAARGGPWGLRRPECLRLREKPRVLHHRPASGVRAHDGAPEDAHGTPARRGLR